MVFATTSDRPSSSDSHADSTENSRGDQAIAAAKRASPERVGQLLEAYRNYLQVLADTQIDEKLRGRISPSDLVQETMLGAFKDFGQFQGDTQRQLLAWLRMILVNRLHVFVQEHVLAKKRDVRREFSLEDIGAALSRSTANLEAGAFLADRGPSPSAIAIGRENAVVLADHLAALPEDYRQVIELRNLRGLPFGEVARRMDRSAGAVRMLWLRAIRGLRERMEPASHSELGNKPA